MKKRCFPSLFRPDGKYLASSSPRCIQSAYGEVLTGREIRVFKGHTAPISTAVFSADGKWIASASDDQTVRLWNVETGEEIRRYEGHTDEVWSVRFFSGWTLYSQRIFGSYSPVMG